MFKPVSVLSGGEQSRLRLCMLMDEKVNFLILDEPTNHLDLDSREWIEEAVEEFSGTLLFVSHDRYFIDRFANRIWTLEGGKIQDFRGDYTAYQAYRERQKALTPSPKKEEKAKKEKPKRSGGTKQLKKELAAAEKRMEKLDQLLEALNVQKEAAASDYQKLQELLQQEAAYNAEYDALMETWETCPRPLRQRKDMTLHPMNDERRKHGMSERNQPPSRGVHRGQDAGALPPDGRESGPGTLVETEEDVSAQKEKVDTTPLSESETAAFEYNMMMMQYEAMLLDYQRREAEEQAQKKAEQEAREQGS
ncbi:MAG: ATP-binding cassette domain-containing protein [Evtepia gabavorous]